MHIDAQRNTERLLNAARDVFVEEGVDVPLEDIAHRAGVGIATLYRRFPDRVALMRAVALHVLVQVTAEARVALAEESDRFRALSRYLPRCLDLRIAAVMPVLDGQLDIGHDDELGQAVSDGLVSDGHSRVRCRVSLLRRPRKSLWRDQATDRRANPRTAPSVGPA